MPKLTRLSLRAAMVYLVAALLVYVHLLVVGWLTQLIFGVAYWMFPVYTNANPYRSVRLAWAMFWALNIGLLLRVAAEIQLSSSLFVAAALLQWLAGVAFVVNSWARVKGRAGAA